MIPRHLAHQAWFAQIPEDLQVLISSSLELFHREHRLQSNYQDYAFLIFPLAKAYEGVLKHYLLESGLISPSTFASRRFRIGRALNPDVSQNQRDKWWLFDDLVRQCGQEVAYGVWQAWLECRNHVFHYFPQQQNHFSLDEAERKMEQLLRVMEALMYCTIADHAAR